MTLRQSFLKIVYPLFLRLSKRSSARNKIHLNEKKITPPFSIYDLSFELNSGEIFLLDKLKGSAFIIVNTASDCGYTEQYNSLQSIFQKKGFTILGFPANDFKGQEAGTDKEIATFCKKNYGITFPVAKKTTVIKSDTQHPIFKWLCDRKQNGWNGAAPTWNFCKYLIDENGNLIGCFASAIEPEDVVTYLGNNR